MLISYCLRTNYADERKFIETLASINRQTGDKEIIVCGIAPNSVNYTYIPMAEEANTGKTSIMRDRGFEYATGSFIVAMDDDIILADDFQEHIGEEHLQIPQCIQFPYGGRFWDWCVIDHPKLGQRKVPYDMPYTKYHYLSGQCSLGSYQPV